MAWGDACFEVRSQKSFRQVPLLILCSQSLNTSSLVTLDPPSALAPRVLNALKADARTVDLRALAPHFYSLGARILELFEEEEMIEVLSDVCDTFSNTTPP